jgi:hypothetical protein
MIMENGDNITTMSEREIARQFFVMGGLEALINEEIRNEDDYATTLDAKFNQIYANRFPVEQGDTVYVKEGFYEGLTGIFLGPFEDEFYGKVKDGDDVKIIPVEYLILNV